VQNHSDRPVRAVPRARVGDVEVSCSPEYLDLLANNPPSTFHVIVPRPSLGDLVHEFANETTLYGETLHVEVAVGDQRNAAAWTETVYDQETNRERYEVQQRVWRIGRGEATQADIRAQMHSEAITRRDRELGISNF
jgi:hypothetical protein